jgi:hypothetical protein
VQNEDSDSLDPPKLTLVHKILLQLPDLGRNKSAKTTSKSSVSEYSDGSTTYGYDESAYGLDESAYGSKPKKMVNQKAATEKPTKKPVVTPKAGPGSDASDSDLATGAALSDADADAAEAAEADDEGSDNAALEPAASSGTSNGASKSTRSSRPAGLSNNPFEKVPTPELVALVKRIDDKERKLAFYAVPLGIVLAIVTTILTIHHNPALHHKGYENPSLIVTDGLITVGFALCVAAAAYYRKRSFTAFALLFLGYSLGLIGIGVPFLVLGGYLIFRMFRVQKVLTSRGVNTRTRDPKARSAQGRTSPRDARSSRDKKTTTTAARPQQSKRYTPPKPPPKRPAPTKADGDAKPKPTLLERAAGRVDRQQQ